MPLETTDDSAGPSSSEASLSTDSFSISIQNVKQEPCEISSGEDDSTFTDQNDFFKKKKEMPRRNKKFGDTKKQQTISSAFEKLADKKRKQSDDLESEKKKKLRLNSSLIKKQDALLARCKQCRMKLSDPNLKIFIGDPDFAVEEFIMLTDPKLNIYNDTDTVDVCDRPQHKITNFSVYDKNRHLCAFDSGLIERSVELFFSGIVKPIYDEDPGVEGGIATHSMGPICEWWISGFDGGEQAIVGFSTGYAEYILMQPSEEYAPFINEIKEKIHLSKIIIEYLSENTEATYEDLLYRLSNAVPLQGLPCLTEDTLLRHAQFVVDQIQSYDSAADDNDNIIIVAPCVRALINLAGVTLGKRRAIRRGQTENLFKPKKPVHSLATTTQLVRDTFEIFFNAQLEKDPTHFSAPRKKRCGVCESCQLPDCGQCVFCRDMIKFGGTGRGKQACAQRKCPNMAVQEANEDDLNEDKEEDIKKKSNIVSNMRKHQTKKITITTSWVGKSLKKQSSKTWYQGVSIMDEVINVGDCVFVIPEDTSTALFIAKVISLWETDSGKQMFHALWFCRGSETVLGETSDSAEIFGTFECEDMAVNCIHSKCTVIHKSIPDNWFELGGTDESLKEIIEEKDEKTFFYQKWYEAETARFEDPPSNIESTDEEGFLACVSCQKQKEIEQLNQVQVKDLLKDNEDNCIYYKEVSFNSYTYNPGDCIYLNPDVFEFVVEKPQSKKQISKKIDEDLYPEAYRKTDYVRGSNKDIPNPFIIAHIKKIYMEKKSRVADEKSVKLRVNLFYRPENTSRSESVNYITDWNMLYWSDNEITVNIGEVRGKCYVIYENNLTETVADYSRKGPNRFYFNEAYNYEKKDFEMPPSLAMNFGSNDKGKGKGKKILSSKETKEIQQPQELYPEIIQPLKSLDVFAGCGGLTEGFHQTGVAEAKWAIEREESAAQAFRLNFPKSIVFSEDCNILLRLVMDGKETHYKGQRLPKKGEVDLLCGGPPCQGYSGMNRFNSRQYSIFKNSLVVSYLSYCDYYRPRFFLLENVRNFVAFKRSMVLKLTLRCLLRMGYQGTFGVLQAGNYGVPQTRRRVIILAAAPGEKLPNYPEPSHVFTARSCQLSVAVDDKRYEPSMKWTDTAPYRTVTVRDSMSDLPPIGNGAKAEEISYTLEPQSHFQRLMRGDGSQQIVRDQICKDMSALVEARMRHIPLEPGSDWRDLPNKVERLKDGNYTNKLVYTHHDVKNGYASNGSVRGVCSCAEKKTCDPLDRQFNTIIPWCLPHTGNRHNNWAGLYGRLDWDGFFSTTVTNPEPMGKQGRVLHPEQHRVVSVRECARSQGFPDSYRFFGNILDRHRQIGNAVPPPMAAAIGLEIKKCVAAKEKENSK